jgi:hypothetical protein
MIFSGNESSKPIKTHYLPKQASGFPSISSVVLYISADDLNREGSLTNVISTVERPWDVVSL